MNKYSILVLLAALGFLSCRSDQSRTAASAKTLKLEGKTMGTTYHVTYFDSAGADYQRAIDSLLDALNDEVSTYIPTSFISKFNQSKSGIPLIGSDGKSIAPHFQLNFEKSIQINRESEGAFDPTVMPLVNYWGFGYTPREHLKVDSAAIDSLVKHFVGFEKVSLVTEGKSKFLQKTAPGIQLDFSAIAKGYGVDAVGLLLESKGVRSYLVEIGGEVRARGTNNQSKPWTVGINLPLEEAAPDEFQTAIQLPDLSIATSGNYRNYHEIAGIKVSHTLNPVVGFPERSNLLSASILAPDCMSADGYATACMVLGLDKGFALIENTPDTEGYFIFGKDDGTLGVKFTKNIEKLLVSPK
jgi:thiamine biosynthesis lipoprotein